MSRQHFPDEVRGLALLGIVVVNVPFLGASLGGFGAGLGGAPAQVAEFLVTVLAQGKFYLIFAFLFGYSAALMLRDGGNGAIRAFARRLLGLAVLGVAHALLFFVGDILLMYAVLGVGLVVLADRSERVVLRVAGVAASLAVIWMAVVVTLSYAYPATGQDPSIAAYQQAISGSFGDAVAGRQEAYGLVLGLLGTLNAGLSLSMFCLGLVAGRRRLLADPAARPHLWRRARRWGLPVGVVGSFAGAVLSLGPVDPTEAIAFQGGGRYVLGIVIGFVTAPALAAGYMGLLAALVARRPSALAIFRPAGRMSLTLYLGESVVLSAIFCGWGGGLFGQLNAFAVLGIGVAAWVVLDLFAQLWMRRFRQGPIEYLLRWWTHWRRPVMLLAPEGAPRRLSRVSSGRA